MITGVPDHTELTETATGWLNLAWDIVIDEAKSFQEVEFLYHEIEERKGRELAERAINQHWNAQRLRLNNAISLLQQSLEIFLKARIAEASPFLLIVGDPQSWPSPDSSGNVDFAEFRTLDALHLCRAARIVSATSLPEQFVQFYTRLRKERNKIAHLNAGSIKAEAHAIILDILEAHRLLFPGQLWVEFRRNYVDSTGEYSDKEGLFSGDDYTNDKICNEIEVALAELSSRDGKLYFQYDHRKKGLRCPHCLEQRHGDDEWRFAQKSKDGFIKCIACFSVFEIEEYAKKVVDYFGYLDEDGRRRVEEDTRHDLK
jgi:hypothetical protein